MPKTLLLITALLLSSQLHADTQVVMLGLSLIHI